MWKMQKNRRNTKKQKINNRKGISKSDFFWGSYGGFSGFWSLCFKSVLVYQTCIIFLCGLCHFELSKKLSKIYRCYEACDSLFWHFWRLCRSCAIPMMTVQMAPMSTTVATKATQTLTHTALTKCVVGTLLKTNAVKIRIASLVTLRISVSGRTEIATSDWTALMLLTKPATVSIHLLIWMKLRLYILWKKWRVETSRVKWSSNFEFHFKNTSCQFYQEIFNNHVCLFYAFFRVKDFLSSKMG